MGEEGLTEQITEMSNEMVVKGDHGGQLIKENNAEEVMDGKREKKEANNGTEEVRSERRFIMTGSCALEGQRAGRPTEPCIWPCRGGMIWAQIAD